MPHISASELEVLLAGLDLPTVILAGFARNPSNPLRQRLDSSDGRELLVMPAANEAFAGVKTLTVVPANSGTGQPVISGLFTLFDFRTGAPLATFDASELTAWRTAAVSAAAASKLARQDAGTLTVLGAGHIVPYLARAFAAIRPIERVILWARDGDRARAALLRIEERLSNPLIAIDFVPDIAAAVEQADILCSATRSIDPIIKGAWVRPSTHIDLVGGYRPDMREIDDDGIGRSRIFVDDRDAALAEAGDIIDPMRRGVLNAGAIEGDLAALASRPPSIVSGNITLFKAVGTAISDLLVAAEAWHTIGTQL